MSFGLFNPGKHLIVNVLHFAVQSRDAFGCAVQLLIKRFRYGGGFLVAQLVFQTGPEIHGNGADLHLYRQQFLARAQENRNFNDYMQASIAVGFGFFDIITHADDPEIIMLLTLDTPDRNTGTYPSGGNMVAPTASAVMSEILPYLGYAPDYSAEEMAAADTTVPNCVGLSKKEAVAKLEKSGFAYKLVGDGDKVTDQTPVGNAIVPNNATVILYMGAEKSQELCKVPIVVGMTAAKANQALTNAGLIMRVTGVTDAGSGNVYAISQDVNAGDMVEAGTVVTVRFGDNSSLD